MSFGLATFAQQFHTNGSFLLGDQGPQFLKSDLCLVNISGRLTTLVKLSAVANLRPDTEIAGSRYKKQSELEVPHTAQGSVAILPKPVRLEKLEFMTNASSTTYYNCEYIPSLHETIFHLLLLTEPALRSRAQHSLQYSGNKRGEYLDMVHHMEELCALSQQL